MEKFRALNKQMLVVNCATGVSFRETAGENGLSEIDPHIWMSPENAAIMVQNIYEGLLTIDPANKSYYEQNRDAYLQELSRLDREIRDGLSGVSDRVFMAYHPSFGYFAREYDLTMLSIEDEGKEPTATGMARVIAQAKEHNITVIFTEPQFDPRSAEVIADAINGRVVSIDPLAGDYLDNMRRFLDELALATNKAGR
jgi:zinc transport system substrate-binding protein